MVKEISFLKFLKIFLPLFFLNQAVAPYFFSKNFLSGGIEFFANSLVIHDQENRLVSFEQCRKFFFSIFWKFFFYPATGAQIFYTFDRPIKRISLDENGNVYASFKNVAHLFPSINFFLEKSWNLFFFSKKFLLLEFSALFPVSLFLKKLLISKWGKKN